MDLSFNKIDQSSEVIVDYLAHDECILKVLVLNGADIDDDECGHLATAIMSNVSITSISITNNLIGYIDI